MKDYSEYLIEVKSLIKEIEIKTNARKFEVAKELAKELDNVTFQLYSTISTLK